MNENAGKKVLLLTVGAGSAEKLEETIITPFKKSFESGEWDRIILFPSKATEATALLLAERFPQFPIEIRALRKEGQEEDADACFQQFDGAISEIVAQGYPPSDITADITRGTKAMSAALLMAAMVHQAGHVRYISAERRDSATGMTTPGAERICDVVPAQILLKLKVNQAFDYLRAGNYRAVENLFPGAPKKLYPGHFKEEIRFLAWAALFWGAWDRFDYKTASDLGRRDSLPAAAPASIEPFLPSGEQIELLQKLSGTAPPKSADNPGFCRALCADLLANAARRFREGQNEEVLVRLYRVLELMGQLRLFTHGIDAGAASLANDAVRAWWESSDDRPKPDSEGTLKLGRLQAARLLEFVENRAGVPEKQRIAAKLADLKQWLGDWGPEMRNTSVLIHGFKARSRKREQELEKVLDKVRQFYFDEQEGNQKLFAAAQFPFLTQSGPAAAI